ncbi:MAG: hypothetical protein A3K45_02525 [Chloroflexi bacterium RIFOXYC12_FULL_59_14]|nr:MAG: hypothetical protein A3K45_02525 [Chloroflexi bacterium RIFOXYC12_FULL_59_14]PIV28192.1 MAG: hypothetical protein COS37_01385 [Anaerolineae bacterium CG03_land_8_20_14_0_80_58_20]
MKKTPASKKHEVQEMASEYRFDYSKAKPNCFASRMKDAPGKKRKRKEEKEGKETCREKVNIGLMKEKFFMRLPSSQTSL